MTRILLLAGICAGTVAAQSLSIGLLGGAPFSDLSKNSVSGLVTSIPNSPKFTIGPALQVNLPLKFRIEVDALFRPYDANLILSTNRIALGASQWRFPVMLQKRIGDGRIQPFVGGGVSFSHITGLAAGAKTLVTSGPGAFLRSGDLGPVMTAGVDIKVPLVRVSGEFRYTRQVRDYFSALTTLNQAEFLLGIHF